MSLLGYLPLVLVAAVVGAVLLVPSVPALDRAFTRIALQWFRGVVDRRGRRRAERADQLQATHAQATYVVYAARTHLYSLVVGVAAAVFGAYAGLAGLSFLIAHREAVEAALPEPLHFVIGAGPSLNPLGSLPLVGGGGSAGAGIPIGVPGWLTELLPPAVVGPLSWLWNVLPDGLTSSVVVGPPGGDGGSVDRVEILIRPPDLGLVPDSLASLSAGQVILLLLVALAVGAVGAALANWFRWYDVRSRAREREILIDESFVRTIAFVYALSRSGMLFPEIMRTVSRNRKAFGETAEELSVAVKQMDLFGADVITAMDRTAKWTPSDHFAEFLGNFANVLQSGQHVPEYLRERYDQAQRERVEHQEQLLEYFTALGEGYVAILVAGPLFLVMILTIFGILFGGQYRVLQFIIYVALPLANLGFIYYLGSLGQTMATVQIPDREDTTRVDLALPEPAGTPPEVLPDGGVATVEENLRRLRLYNRLRPVRWAMKYPVETLTRKPLLVLYLVGPLALASVAVRWAVHPGDAPAATVDDWVIQAGLLTLGSFAVVQEIHRRRLKRIEAAVPDFLDSLASANEAGRTFTESIKRLGSTEFDVLGEEFQRLLVDIEWGARTEEALRGFSERIGSPTVARVVALLTNALRASDQIGPVIRIAAEEARKDRSLKRKRRQEMFMYVLIVYISFVVFLGITIALKTILVPAVPSAEQLAGAGGGGPLGISVMVDSSAAVAKESYTLLLFHTAAVQAVVSGLVAGKMGEGNAFDGAKHATIMLAIAYGIFTFLG